MRRSWQPASAFSRAGRSGGSQALQLPRASLSRGSFASRLHLDRALQKSEISAPEPLSLIRRGLEGVRPSSSRDYHFLAAARHISPAPDRVPQKLEISVPVLLSHIRRGLEGARPVCFISRKTHRNNRSYCNKNFHQIQLGKINAVKRTSPARSNSCSSPTASARRKSTASNATSSGLTPRSGNTNATIRAENKGEQHG